MHSIDRLAEVVDNAYPHKCPGLVKESEHKTFIYLIAAGISPRVAPVKEEDLAAAVLEELQLLVAAGKKT